LHRSHFPITRIEHSIEDTIVISPVQEPPVI